jgi:hypothetical protein
MPSDKSLENIRLILTVPLAAVVPRAGLLYGVVGRAGVISKSKFWVFFLERLRASFAFFAWFRLILIGTLISGTGMRTISSGNWSRVMSFLAHFSLPPSAIKGE